MSGIALLVSTLLGLGLADSSSPRRPPMIQVNPVTVQGGFNASYGYCPCFRWTVGVQLLGGQWETREFLITTDALFQLELNASLVRPVAPRLADVRSSGSRQNEHIRDVVRPQRPQRAVSSVFCSAAGPANFDVLNLPDEAGVEGAANRR